MESVRGRGAASNPANRFEKLAYEPDEEYGEAPEPARKTEYLRDTTRTIISSNNSPDVGFERSINPYRGCEHGCIYCYARPTHEFLGFSAGLDFETKILVKEDGPELLRAELSSPRWQPTTLALSGVTDPYQPIERRLQITRRCLQVLAEFRNPVAVITKNRLVCRDTDLLAELAKYDAAAVSISVTTLDRGLARDMEPRTSRPELRLQAIRELSQAGIPVGVLVAPVIPGLTDHELPAILKAAAQAGARTAGFVALRLPLGVAELFEDWLSRQRPLRRDKVLGQIRALRGGAMNDSRFGIRMKGEGPVAERIQKLFELGCRLSGLGSRGAPLSTAAFRRPAAPGQLDLFEGTLGERA